MKKRVLVPIANGFEEIETMTIVDVLRRAGLEVILAGTEAGLLTGSRQVRVMPDAWIEEVQDEDFDALVLPGGQPGVDHLRKNAVVLQILQKMSASKKWIGAICAAPLVLRDAGLIAGRHFTSFPALEPEFQEGQYEQASVIVDGHLVTSRGPGTSMEFALKLVELLCGKEKREQTASALLAPAATR